MQNPQKRSARCRSAAGSGQRSYNRQCDGLAHFEKSLFQPTAGEGTAGEGVAEPALQSAKCKVQSEKCKVISDFGSLQLCPTDDLLARKPECSRPASGEDLGVVAAARFVARKPENSHPPSGEDREEGGRWKAEGGRRKVEGGRRKVVVGGSFLGQEA
jgi:hypothetical protein